MGPGGVGIISRTTRLPSRTTMVETTGFTRPVMPRAHSGSPRGPNILSVRMRRNCRVKNTFPIHEGLFRITHRMASITKVETSTRTLCKTIVTFFGTRTLPRNRHIDPTRLTTDSTDKITCTVRRVPKMKFGETCFYGSSDFVMNITDVTEC